MRGSDERSGALFSYVNLEARVRKDHPLGVIRAVVNEALVAIEREIAFRAMQASLAVDYGPDEIGFIGRGSTI